MPVTVCTRPECQTTAGCKCTAGHVFTITPSTYVIEQPTMMLRWNDAVLEQAWTRTQMAGSEVIWRAVPQIDSQ